MNNLDTTRQIGPGGVDLLQREKTPDKLAPDSARKKDVDINTDINNDLNQLMSLLSHVALEKIPSESERVKTQMRNTDEINLWDKFRLQFVNGPDWFKAFRSHFTLGMNYFGVAFNSLAVVGKAFLPEKVHKFVDEKSEWFSKYVIPISFAWNGVEALVGHRIPEALSRLIPAVSFWALPFYNFNLATGLSSGLNYVFEHVKERNGGKNPGAGDLVENMKKTFSDSVDVLTDIVKGKRDKEDIYKQVATVGLLGGSLGGMLFTRHSRDSFWARVFGNMRNICGLFADYKLIFNNAKDPAQSHYQRQVGSLCSLASILNIFMRWVNPEMARMLNHISIAADDFGLTRWAQVSKEDNDRELSKTLAHLHIAG